MKTQKVILALANKWILQSVKQIIISTFTVHVVWGLKYWSNALNTTISSVHKPDLSYFCFTERMSLTCTYMYAFLSHNEEILESNSKGEKQNYMKRHAYMYQTKRFHLFIALALLLF